MKSHSFISLIVLAPVTTFAATISRRDLSPASADLPSGWSYSGCYVDSVSARSLSSASTNDGSGLTGQSCIAFCASKGYTVAGTEYSDECYCGLSLPTESSQGCNMACSGDSTQACGGPNALSVYTTSDASSAPTTNPGPNGWTSIGCYSDSSSARTLGHVAQTPGGFDAMTVAVCTTACLADGYLYAGVEYSGECYCGDTFDNGGSPASDGCSRPCTGNITELCGGPDRLNVYAAPPTTNPGPSGWSSLGCYSDSVSARTLARCEPTEGGSSELTVAICTAACHADGYIYAGMEYSGECYCGNTLDNGGSSVSDGCTMPCYGNITEFCGGSNRLNLYTSGAANGPVTNPGPDGWESLGCYSDSVSARTLARSENTAGGPDAVTVASCTSACLADGYTYAGLEYAGECYCGNTIDNGGASATDGCNMPCKGNFTEYCGGPNRLNLYTSGPATGPATSPATGPVTNPGPPGWVSFGCYTDSKGTTLNYLEQEAGSVGAMTVKQCTSSCQSDHYTYAGVELGGYCYCGNGIDVIASPPSEGCTTPCAGNSTEFCGGTTLWQTYTASNTNFDSGYPYLEFNFTWPKSEATIADEAGDPFARLYFSGK